MCSKKLEVGICLSGSRRIIGLWVPNFLLLGEKLKILEEDLKGWNGKELGNVAAHKIRVQQIRN